MHFLTRPRVTAVLSAASGAAAFMLLGLPLPLFLGPLMGCLVAALAGAQMQGMGRFGNVMRAFLGAAIGASLTPQMISALPGYLPTLILMPLFILAIGLVGYPLFRRLYGFDPVTSFYSAMPGGLQDMLLFGEEAGGNVRTMSLIHATRVLVVVTIAPVILTLVYGLDLTAPPGQSAAVVPPAQIALVTAAAMAGWWAAARIGMFGAAILGPMILAAVLSLSGILTARPPAEIIWVAQFVLGLGVGVKYVGVTWPELRRVVGAGLFFSIVLMMLSLLFFWIALKVSFAPTLDILLAFLPGGQAEMAIIAIMAGADLAFVIGHHLVRILVVILLAPVFASRLR